jgi:hypothetical protein
VCDPFGGIGGYLGRYRVGEVRHGDQGGAGVGIGPATCAGPPGEQVSHVVFQFPGASVDLHEDGARLDVPWQRVPVCFAASARIIGLRSLFLIDFRQLVDNAVTSNEFLDVKSKAFANKAVGCSGRSHEGLPFRLRRAP